MRVATWSLTLAKASQRSCQTFEELIAGGLHILCLLGQDATLCAVTGKSGKVETTDLYRQVYKAAGDIKPKNISIDTLSRVPVARLTARRSTASPCICKRSPW
jgi:hypothetical protein